MKVGNSMVVEIHFTLKNDSGEVIDKSEGKEPLIYLHGASDVVEGLEDALDELEKGDSFEVCVPPEKGYGLRDFRLVKEVPINRFPKEHELLEGSKFITEGPNGLQPIYVLEVRENTVLVDGNHELAGQNLHFSGTVVSVREATQQELQEGHIHHH